MMTAHIEMWRQVNGEANASSFSFHGNEAIKHHGYENINRKNAINVSAHAIEINRKICAKYSPSDRQYAMPSQ